MMGEVLGFFFTRCKLKKMKEELLRLGGLPVYVDSSLYLATYSCFVCFSIMQLNFCRELSLDKRRVLIETRHKTFHSDSISVIEDHLTKGWNISEYFLPQTMLGYLITVPYFVASFLLSVSSIVHLT